MTETWTPHGQARNIPVAKMLQRFAGPEIHIVNEAVAMAEELVSDYFKMSSSQWLHARYDIKTAAELHAEEIVLGPFAQIIRYQASKQTGHSIIRPHDFYKICLQDHAILQTIGDVPSLQLFPFCLYILTHELIHIVRFCKFLQSFEASRHEIKVEEIRVHAYTRNILGRAAVSGLESVVRFFIDSFLDKPEP